MPLSITADLQLEVGGVRSTLTDRAGELVLTAEDPAAMLGHAREAARLLKGVTPSPGLQAALRELPDGTRLVLAGPDGDVASVRLLDGRVRPTTARVSRPQDLVDRRSRLTLLAVLAAITALVVRRLTR